MNKKFVTFLLSMVLALPFLFAFGGCNCEQVSTKKTTARQVFAMCAVSSSAYLENEGLVTSSLGMNNKIGVDRPSSYGLTEMQKLNDYVNMFKSLITSSALPLSSTPTESDGAYSGYKVKLSFTLGETTYNLFYTETLTENSEEVDEEDGEVEQNSTLTGKLIIGTDVFNISGTKQVETEDNETEVEITFTTKTEDNKNYITVTQEIEAEEVGYEYEVYENNALVHKAEVEYENEDDGVEFEVKIKNNATSVVVIDCNFTVSTENGETVLYANKVGENYDFKITLGSSTNTYLYANGYTENL